MPEHEGDRQSIAKITSALARVRAHAEGYQHEKAQLRETLAPDFTLFQFLKTDELGLSQLLGWLLDPQGSHGQGARFLQAFVAVNEIPWGITDCAVARVRLEAKADRITWATRRIDILVVADGKALAIENKPSAEDQPNQLTDYLQHLERLAPRGRTLVYLSSDGKPPDKSSIAPEELTSLSAQGQLLVRSYGSLLPWLDACRAACRAERVRLVIEDFQRHIERRFLGVRDMDQTKRLAAMIAETPEFVSSAWQIGAAIPQLRAELIKKLDDDLTALATARGWVFSSDLGDRPKWGGLQFQFTAGDPLAFRIEMGDVPYADTYFGIRAAERLGVAPPGPRRDAIRAALSAWSAAPLKASEERWIWMRNGSDDDPLLPLPRDWAAAPELWAGMADQSVANKIIAAAEQIRSALAAKGALLEIAAA